MDIKTTLLVFFMLILIILSVGVLFYKSVVFQDFEIVDIEKQYDE